MHLLRPILIAACVFLSACQEELYRDLPENQANIMAAKLLRAGISVEKKRQKDSLITLSVESDSFADSVEILSESGYPQNEYTDSAKMFKEQGMISSPTEEWARMVYARSQEIARTISEFEGVIVARVHIAVPKKTSIIDKPVPPSASVFIKYKTGYDLSNMIPNIKQLVARSIEGLDYQGVSIILTESQGSDILSAEYEQFAGLALHPKSVTRLQIIFLIGLLILILPSGLAGWLYYKKSEGKSDASEI
ncbi:MAG: type III secretion inner membrane ring lipoprotein SctJ [Halopseudomonas aestusnigri]